MTITYIITKTQSRNDGYGYPSTMILYVTTSEKAAVEEFQKVTSRAKPHRILSDIFIETGDEVTSIYRLHEEELMG